VRIDLNDLKMVSLMIKNALRCVQKHPTTLGCLFCLHPINNEDNDTLAWSGDVSVRNPGRLAAVKEDA